METELTAFRAVRYDPRTDLIDEIPDATEFGDFDGAMDGVECEVVEPLAGWGDWTHLVSLTHPLDPTMHRYYFAH